MRKALSQTPTADEIAAMASRGKDVSRYFTNKFKAVGPIRRVNVDLPEGILRELDTKHSARMSTEAPKDTSPLLWTEVQKDD